MNPPHTSNVHHRFAREGLQDARQIRKAQQKGRIHLFTSVIFSGMDSAMVAAIRALRYASLKGPTKASFTDTCPICTYC